MLQRSEIINELVASLAKAQSEMGVALKDSVAKIDGNKGSYTYRYATLANVIGEVRPALTRNGLAVLQPFWIAEDGKYYLTTMLMHVSGQWLLSEVLVEPTARTPQAIGSALTYMRRYALSSLVCLAADDDDGAEASRPVTPSKPVEYDPAHVALANEFVRLANADATRAGVADIAAQFKTSSLPDALREQTVARIREIYLAKQDQPAS